jgi:HD domain-containing protein
VTLGRADSASAGGPVRLVTIVAALVTVASVVDTVVSAGQQGVVSVRVAVAFTALIAVGEFARIMLPGGRQAAPLGAAGAMAYALLPGVADVPAQHSAAQVVMVTVVGMALGGLPHALVGRAPQPDYLARRVLSTALAAVLFRLFHGGSGIVDLPVGPRLALVMAAIVVVTDLADAALAAGARAAEAGAPFRAALRDELRALIGISSAIGATGVLIALGTNAVDLWAIPVLCGPLLIAQLSFRLYAAARLTYLQTVRALSRVTDLGGYTETGHARRVSELAVAVGRDLGLAEDELLDLEYAALMHDIGQLSLADAIPGGATIMVDREEQRRIARMGAAVIRQTGVLDEVATIVERQTDPCGLSGEQSPPIASRIIKVVNAMEDLVGGSGEYQARLDALEQLRLAFHEYDPRVVESLARVVGRGVRYG